MVGHHNATSRSQHTSASNALTMPPHTPVMPIDHMDCYSEGDSAADINADAVGSLQSAQMGRSTSINNKYNDAAGEPCKKYEPEPILESPSQGIMMKDNHSSDEMTKAGSDDWSNFIVIDQSSSQGSFANNTTILNSGNTFLYHRCSISPNSVEELELPAVQIDEKFHESDKMHVTDEVCRLLGVPIGNKHRIRVNIVSSNTEQKLRDLMQKPAQAGQKRERQTNGSDEGIAFTADKFTPFAHGENLDTAKHHKPKEQNSHSNILAEGEYYLAMSMLVYIYTLLREAAILGHTTIGFDDIDVNLRNNSNEHAPYLENTKSAGFIIRVVMDELQKNESLGGAVQDEDLR